MSDAFYHEGLTIEYDSSDKRPRLNIDGQPINVARAEGRYRAPNLASPDLPSLEHKCLYELGKLIIDNYPEYQTRKCLRYKHLEELHKGVAAWNSWRSDHQEIRPLLYEADISRMGRLASPNFANANLIRADEANLGGAEFCGATLIRANFCRTDLYETDFSKATLIEANLQGTQLAKTKFIGATLDDCKIYGMSAWDLKLDKAKQKNHIVKYRYDEDSAEAEITVDDLRVAQFVYLMLHNERIKDVIETINSKAVLILGRFTRERKNVLEKLREALRKEQFLPIIFDFERPSGRTLTETVVTLASLSRFIIVDITTPRSSPLELQATVPVFQVPFAPIIDSSVPEEEAFAMFKDLQAAFGDATGRLLRLLRYSSAEILVQVLRPAIIEPAQERAEALTAIKNEPLRTVDAESYLGGQV